MIEATPGADEDHEAVAVTSRIVPSVSVAVAVKACVVPLAMVALAGVTAVPGAFARTSPPITDATAGSELAHSAERVTSSSPDRATS